MKNQQLVDLNFREVLHYQEGQPPVQEHYDPPVACSGFCIACEEQNLLQGTGVRLDQMSHGCDTEDLQQLLGPLPEPGDGGAYIDKPVLFLFESPGSSYDNGNEVVYRGITKRPPTNHYYWAPPTEKKEWPTNPDKLPHLYGPYLAYLIARFGFTDAYITNAVKCGKSRIDSDRFEPFSIRKRNESFYDTQVWTECYKRFLAREIKEVNPAVIFAFGQEARKMSRLLRSPKKPEVLCLLHPAARCSRRALVERNNDRIRQRLTELGLRV